MRKIAGTAGLTVFAAVALFGVGLMHAPPPEAKGDPKPLAVVGAAMQAPQFALALPQAQPKQFILSKDGKTKYYFGRVAPANITELHRLAFARHGNRIKALPKATAASFDCRTMGWVPPIRDQGQCGSCWDFSGSGMVTSALIKGGVIPNGQNQISEQYTLDCGNNGGCNGDDNTNVLDWCKSRGLPLDSDYGPYQANSNRCKQVDPSKLLKIKDWGYCTPNQQQGVASTQDIKNAMVAYGPIGCAVAAGGGSWWNSGQGIDTGNDTGINHDVILVGWDDTKGNGGAWLMRNSWGTSWGVDGYGWMAYGADQIGTEAVWAIASGLPPVLPTLTTASPTSGSAGTTVTLAGTGLNAVTAVNFGAVPATSFTITNAAALTAVAPAGTGIVNVTVTNAAGTSNGVAFSYGAIPPPPGGSSITLNGPAFGNVAGQTLPIGQSPGGGVTLQPDTVQLILRDLGIVIPVTKKGEDGKEPYQYREMPKEEKKR